MPPSKVGTREGRGQVTQPIDYHDERGAKFDEREADMIRQVWEKYGHLSGGRLSEMTHRGEPLVPGVAPGVVLALGQESHYPKRADSRVLRTNSQERIV